MNYYYKVDHLETQGCYLPEVFCNSDLLSVGKPFYEEKEAYAWAEGFIQGIKFARGEA